MRLELESESNSPVAVLDGNSEIDPAPSIEPARLVRNGIAAAQQGDRERARELLTQAVDAEPNNEEAWMWLASISDYPEELLAFLNKVLSINPYNTRAVEWHAATCSLLAKTFIQRGIAAHNEGATDLANSCFDQALGHDENSAVAWFWKATVSPSDEEKIAYLERALELDPASNAAKEALDLLRPPTPEATLEDAKWAAVAGKRKKALEILDDILANGHSTAEAWVLRSHLSIGLSDKVEALEKALALEPDNQHARAGYDFLTATVREARAAEEHISQPEPIDETPSDELVEPVQAVEKLAVEDANIDPPIEEPVEAVHVADEQALEDPGDGIGSNENLVEPTRGVDEHDAAQAMEEGTSFEALVQVEEEVSEVFGSEESVSSANDFVENDDPAFYTAAESPFLETVDEAEDDASAVEFYAPILDATELEEFESEDEIVEATEFVTESQPVSESTAACPFCDAAVDPQAFECGYCHAALTLSDIESLLANPHADRDLIHRAIVRMEAEQNLRDLDIGELTVLGIAHFNVRSFEKGFFYLQEASRLDPNNVILSGQVNALAIRLDEMRRQDEIDESKPRGKSILVVDDSPTVRKLISAKLEKSGHIVTCAADGVEGLEKLEDGLPDLVLLDIAMPRMDGYEVCKQIRSNPAAVGLPVVMISGKDGFFDKVRGKMAGCTGYVTKPFGPETLMKALETYLIPENGYAE